MRRGRKSDKGQGVGKEGIAEQRPVLAQDRGLFDSLRESTSGTRKGIAAPRRPPVPKVSGAHATAIMQRTLRPTQMQRYVIILKYCCRLYLKFRSEQNSLKTIFTAKRSSDWM